MKIAMKITYKSITAKLLSLYRLATKTEPEPMTSARFLRKLTVAIAKWESSCFLRAFAEAIANYTGTVATCRLPSEKSNRRVRSQWYKAVRNRTYHRSCNSLFKSSSVWHVRRTEHLRFSSTDACENTMSTIVCSKSGWVDSRGYGPGFDLTKVWGQVPIDSHLNG